MSEITLEMIKSINSKKYPSNIVKEYYEVIRELISTIALLDGYRTSGEGAHKRLIDYLKFRSKEFSAYELELLEDLRELRNKIAYDGYFIKNDYLERRSGNILNIISKLHKIIEEKFK